jgi:D-alanyl-D-alanine carboxypeptidase
MIRLTLPATILACLAATAVLVAASAAAKPASASSTQASGLQKDLDALVAAGAPGAILFVRDGNRITHLTAGLGDIARKTPMRPDNHFKIASLTKTFTATIVLQLVGEGSLGLDDTVERRLPGVVPNGRRITIRQLLNHTSGLFDFENDPRYLKPYLNGNFGYHWAPRQLARMAVSHKPLFAPGTRWSYSNTNYVVAQLILEKATGHTIGAELQQRIFQPLGLRNTIYPTKTGLPSPYAHGYRNFGKPPLVDVTGLSPSLAPGSGAIVSTVRDIADFYRALLAGRLLKSEQLKAMETRVSERTGEVASSGPGYGLGIARSGVSRPSAAVNVSCVGWGHSGELAGYDVSTAFSENGQRQAILMINQDASTLAKNALPLYYRLINKAYCGA